MHACPHTTHAHVQVESLNDKLLVVRVEARGEQVQHGGGTARVVVDWAGHVWACVGHGWARVGMRGRARGLCAGAQLHPCAQQGQRSQPAPSLCPPVAKPHAAPPPLAPWQAPLPPLPPPPSSPPSPARPPALQEQLALQIEELKRRLRAERGLRKTCEKWMRSELRSRVRGCVAVGQGLRG